VYVCIVRGRWLGIVDEIMMQCVSVCVHSHASRACECEAACRQPNFSYEGASTFARTTSSLSPARARRAPVEVCKEQVPPASPSDIPNVASPNSALDTTWAQKCHVCHGPQQPIASPLLVVWACPSIVTVVSTYPARHHVCIAAILQCEVCSARIIPCRLPDSDSCFGMLAWGTDWLQLILARAATWSTQMPHAWQEEP
jgi:hypothetical protein